METYNKFRFLIILIALFITSCDKSEAQIDSQDGKGNNPGITNEGYVRSAQTGVANVVVTDGTNFAVTDKDGKYILPYNTSASLIYLSSPAGYTVPVENSVPKFWINIRNVADRKAINFELIKSPASDQNHYFIAVGDPQVRNTKELNLLKPILSEMANNIDKNKLNPVHLMVVGDIVFDTPNMHDESKMYFSVLKQPVYYAIGNHDHLKTTTTSILNDRTSDSTYIRHYGPTYYSFNKGQVHYIALDNILFEGGPDTKYSVGFTQEQLDWVKKDLSYVSKDKALVVMFHAPSMSRFQESYGNSADLHKLLAGYANVHLLSGHTHYNSVMDNGAGIIEHMVGAACGGFWEGPVCLDGTNLGYKVFKVNGTEIQWEYRDYLNPDDQFSVFKPGEARPDLAPASNELLVNVWDWDTNWKVSYSEDNGKTYKVMPRYNEQNRVYDPLSLTYFGIKGDNTVPGRTWIGASKTDHIFTMIPSEGVSKVIIKAESRFKTYIKEVVL
ncbi:calcineurin-like phosphoesterase C-terminal domain-containing protein [Dysgonomonas termitidis]|uniref:Calcineurin-like phosphoesterase C-terminal domain-containing protein n=1 Tax=Dysgonomonas termitidis TaxID=1516126 RepID=A0ABV9KQU7_9BACT